MQLGELQDEHCVMSLDTVLEHRPQRSSRTPPVASDEHCGGLVVIKMRGLCCSRSGVTQDHGVVLCAGFTNRWEPVRFDRLLVKPVRSGSGLDRYQTGPNSKFKFEFKKNEKFLKILQGATNLMVSNFLKNSFV